MYPFQHTFYFGPRLLSLVALGGEFDGRFGTIKWEFGLAKFVCIQFM